LVVSERHLCNDRNVIIAVNPFFPGAHTLFKNWPGGRRDEPCLLDFALSGTPRPNAYERRPKIPSFGGVIARSVDDCFLNLT
jgi:hypothetical protein